MISTVTRVVVTDIYFVKCRCVLTFRATVFIDKAHFDDTEPKIAVQMILDQFWIKSPYKRRLFPYIHRTKTAYLNVLFDLSRRVLCLYVENIMKL